MVPEDFAFDPTEPWELQLLVQRATGAREKAFLTFDLAYALPDRYIKSRKTSRDSAASCRGDACSCCGGRRLFGSRCGGEAQYRLASQASPLPF